MNLNVFLFVECSSLLYLMVSSEFSVFGSLLLCSESQEGGEMLGRGKRKNQRNLSHAPDTVSNRVTKKRKQEDEILPVVILFLFLGEFLFYCY